jgi:hypothetical protein
MLILLSALIAASQVQPTPPGPEIVVEGRQTSRDAINRTTGAIGRPESAGGFVTQYARWTEPVCVSVAGLPRDGGQIVADRIGSVARALKIGARGPGCTPNIFVIVAHDPKTLIQKLDLRFPTLAYGISTAELAHVAAGPDPVRWIRTTGFTSAQGDPAQPDGFGLPGRSVTALPQWAASNIQASTKITTARMTIIVDAGQIEGLNYGQLSAYLALIALAQCKVAAGVPPVDSILSIFAHGDNAPQDLTRFDMAYLKALYTTNQALPADLQRMDIAAAVERDLAGTAKTR